MESSFADVSRSSYFQTYLFTDNLNFILVGKPIDGAGKVKSLEVKDSYIISCCLKLGSHFINRYGKEIPEGEWVKCDNNDRKNSHLTSDDTLTVTKSIFTFSFISSPDRNTYQLLQIVCKIQVLPKSIQRNSMPTHLFGQLAKTSTGLDLLRKHNVVTTLMDTLRSEKSSLLQRKGALWSIGNIGSSKRGLEYLLETDVIKTMIKSAEECEVLSLRGTALYSVGLISRTDKGKIILKQYGWCVYNKAGISVTTPKHITTFFTISPFEYKGDYTKNKEIWQCISNTIGRYKLPEEYLRVTQLIGELSNHITRKNALPELKRISQVNPKIFMDARLYHCVVLILTNYSFKYQYRKYIIQFFDKLLSSSNFLANYNQAISVGKSGLK